MSEGDQAAAFELYAEVGDAVRGSVARVARGLNATHLSGEDLDALTLDVCMELLSLSRSWDPAGGALPWVWANRRVTTIVSRYVGQYGFSYEDERLADTAAVHHADLDDIPDEVALARLARREPLAALLLDALTSLVSERDLRVVLLFAVQQTQGDPSPSHTVADATGLRPDNVRQIVSRTRRSLAELVGSDTRFEDLGTLPFLGLSEVA
jgi:DNA-directed RNA polymerase specialized sigma24 family protein